MWRRSILVAWSLALLLVLLPPGSASRTADASTLPAALLTTDDLPPGWQAQGTWSASASDYDWCPGEAATADQAVEQMATWFTGGSVSPLLYQEVLRFAPGGAEHLMAALRRSQLGCAWEETSADAAPMVFTLGAVTPIALGDEAVVRRLVAHWETTVVEADIVIVRQQDHVTVVTHVALGQHTGTLDTRLTMDVAHRAAEKLDGVVQ